MLLTLAGWTSSKIAEAFGVREDTVRLWRSDFTAGGVAALKTSIAPGQGRSAQVSEAHHEELRPTAESRRRWLSWRRSAGMGSAAQARVRCDIRLLLRLDSRRASSRLNLLSVGSGPGVG